MDALQTSLPSWPCGRQITQKELTHWTEKFLLKCSQRQSGGEAAAYIGTSGSTNIGQQSGPDRPRHMDLMPGNRALLEKESKRRVAEASRILVTFSQRVREKQLLYGEKELRHCMGRGRAPPSQRVEAQYGAHKPRLIDLAAVTGKVRQ